jgi:DNA repair protein RadB
MEGGRVSSGSDAFDSLLNGGFEADVITTVYGPSGSGKSNICLVAAVNIAKQGKKAVFIDSEGGFSVERLKQLEPNYKPLLDNIMLLKPTTFEEQKMVFDKLIELTDNSKDGNIGIIVVDTISMLYRLELGKNEDIYGVNKELGRQISFLTEITRKKNIPVVIANQVYAKFDERDKVNMVGGDFLKYGSKCLIELQKGHEGIRKAVLKKHRALKEEKEVIFKIENEGLFEIKEQL